MSMNEPMLKDQLEQIRNHNHRIAQFLSENCNLPLSRVKELMEKGSSISAQDALTDKLVQLVTHRTVPAGAAVQRVIHVGGQKIV